MAKYKLLVMVNPLEGGDDALNAWLDDIHLRETLTTPGFKKVERYELAPEDAANPKAVHKYMHVYEVETDDLAKTKAAMAAAAPTRTPRSPALDASNVFAVFYKERA